MDATKLDFLKNKKEEEEKHSQHSYYCIGKLCMAM